MVTCGYTTHISTTLQAHKVTHTTDNHKTDFIYARKRVQNITDNLYPYNLETAAHAFLICARSKSRNNGRLHYFLPFHS